jgi:YfiH family protein
MASPLVLKSRLLEERGIRHGFSTRVGGVSEGAFASLNVAVGPGDDPACVAENLRRFADAIGVEPGRLFQVSQVHGAEVRVIEPSDERLAVLPEHGDGLVTWDGGSAIGVRVADCVPVLVHDPEQNGVAALHAGWRGVAAGIVHVGAALLARRSGTSAGMVAAIGPCIGVCCFEVGEEVVDALAQAVPEDGVVDRSRAKAHVDLRLAVRRQLNAIGISDDRIDDVGGCTKCDAERFFSHRRDGARSGRLLGAIAPLG